MKGLLKWGFWQRRWFIIWWLVAIFALVFINMIFYPSFRDQAAEFEKTFQQLPESARSLFSDTGDFLSPTGYLSSQIFYFMLPMLLGILAIALGTSLIGKEEREGTIELILSRQISRTKLLVAKAIVGVVIVVVAGVVGVATTAIMAKAVSLAVPTNRIILAGLVSTLLALSFGAVAFAITMLGRARVASIGISTLYALGGYILVSLAGAATWLKWPSRAFPFYYYRPGAILEGRYEWLNVLFMLAVIGGAAIISWVAFRRRDIG